MFYHIISAEHNKFLQIENIGFSSDPKNNRFGPGRRNIYLIHYVISGKGYFNGNPVTAGQGFLIRPGTYEYYYPSSDDPWTYLWVTICDPTAECLFEKINADSESQIFSYDFIPDVKNLTVLIKANHNKNYSTLKILEIFLHLFNNHEKNQSGTHKNRDIYFEHAVRYIKTNISRPIKISEITEFLGITQPYLYKIFVLKCGMSPKQYIENQKFEFAKKLLSDTQIPISDISRSTGFENPLAFSRAFKKSVGISPSKFREKSSLDTRL